MIRRMIGAAKLSTETFEEVEADSSATIQAMLVVVLVAVATGIGSLGTGGPLGLMLGIIVGLAGWALWAWLTFFIGTKLLATPGTDADWGQLARALGFAQSPGVFKVLGFIPVVGLTLFVVAAIWQLIAMIIAIRQALDYTSTWRAIGVALIGFIPYAIVLGLLQTILRNRLTPVAPGPHPHPLLGLTRLVGRTRRGPGPRDDLRRMRSGKRPPILSGTALRLSA